MTQLFRDPDFQKTLLRYLCRDKNFLKDYGRLLQAEDFRPQAGEANTRRQLAELALGFWKDYRQPLSGMMRTEILDYAQKKNLGERERLQLLRLGKEIRNSGPLVAAEAMGRRVVEYKQRRARQDIVQQLLDLEEVGKLTNEKLLTIASQIHRNFGEQHPTVDYYKAIDTRTERRGKQARRKWPMILIPEIDRRIRILTRGMLGMVLAQYKVGKSVALVWIARAYALQGLNVLFFTLEDPQELVEDRLDALITDIDMKLMPRKSDVVRRRFRERRDDLHGRIKIVDGTEGGMSVAMMEQIWERERDRGFDADAIIIDYDDEIEPPVAYKNREIYRRFEFADIYRELRRWAARRQLIIWTAAQAKRGKGEDQKVVAGEDTAEDISKVRKVHLCLGLGMFKQLDSENGRYLYVAAHKWDAQKIGFGIVGNFARAVLYDGDVTRVKMNRYLVRKRRLLSRHKRL